MTYELPFKPGQRLIELGGGANPRIRPNVDVRPGPSTDLIADFNKPLPLPSNQFDGILSVYVIEHLSWRNVRGFIVEVHRILAPGGTAVLITANTLEQMKNALARERWDETVSSMLFGDLDYPENSHKAAFSPEYAVRLFKEAGFYEVTTLPHPETITDMIIQARKSAAVVSFSLLNPS